MLEDAGVQTVTGWATNISRGPADENGQTLTFLVTTNNDALFSVLPAINSSNGNLTYTSAANANGRATISVRLQDSGGTANGGVDTSAAQTFAINVTAVNDVPSFTKGADQSPPEDAGAQSVAGWATNISAGPTDEAGQTLTFLVTTNNDILFSVLPAVSANGTLTFTPAANTGGSATVTVRLQDNGGTANGGVDTSAAQTFNVTVTTVNDAPVLDNTGNMVLGTILEDAVANTGTLITDLIASAGGDRITDVDGAALEGIAITAANVAGGAWEYSTNDGGAWSALGSVSGTNARLLAADTNTRLRFVPALNFNGSIANAITFRAWDRTSGSNGGTGDTSTNGGTTAFSTASETASIAVTAVNDVPSFTKGADQTVAEDAGAQTAAGWATNISAGPADEAGQTLTFLVTTNNDALFSVLPTVNSSNGNLTYTPAANASGTATVTVRLQDNGGTANGGVDTSAAQTFSIAINAANDAPVLDNAGNMALATILEDAVANTGTLITDLIASAGGDRITDIDSGALEGIAVTAANTVNGTWEYSINDGGAWSALGAVSGTNSRLLFADTQTRLRFVPGLNFNGSIANAITFRAWDRTSGANGGTADSSTNGGTTAFSTATETASIAVTAVNDVPSFTKGTDQTVLEDAATQTVTGWATNISAGAADESSQTLTFLVTTNNDALFSVLPAINSANGNLTYTPAANANGSATVTVRLQDNGGTANGGVDTSAAQTFTITVTAVNDVPSFTKGADQTVLEDAGAQSVADLGHEHQPRAGRRERADALLPGHDQQRCALFSALPAISSSNGNLTYTPAANANGTRDNHGALAGQRRHRERRCRHQCRANVRDQCDGGERCAELYQGHGPDGAGRRGCPDRGRLGDEHQPRPGRRGGSGPHVPGDDE